MPPAEAVGNPAVVPLRVVGTCLPLDALRRLARRSGLVGRQGCSDYELHHGVVNMTCHRTALSELVQKELDGRYAGAVRAFSQLRTDDEIRGRWNEALASGDVPGALRAVMSHPCAAEPLRDAVSQDVHMLSHQIGAASRADLRRLGELERESRALRGLLQRQADRFAAKLADRDRQVAACVLLKNSGLASFVSGVCALAGTASAARSGSTVLVGG